MDPYAELEKETNSDQVADDPYAGLELAEPQQESDPYTDLEPESIAPRSIVKPQPIDTVTKQAPQLINETTPNSVRISRAEAEAMRKAIQENEGRVSSSGLQSLVPNDPNVKKQQLKEPYSHPQTSNPFNTLIGGIVNKYKDWFGDKKHKDPRIVTNPITSDEIDDNVFTNTEDPNTVAVDLGKLNYTYLPREQVMDVTGKQILKYLNKDTPENQELLKEIASIRGTATKEKPGILDSALEVGDALLFNIATRNAVANRIEKSDIAVDDSIRYVEMPYVKEALAKAMKNNNNKVKLDDLGVEINLTLADTPETINRKIHKEIVADILGEYARLGERGLLQFAGNLVQGIVTGGAIAGLGKLASVPRAAAQLAKAGKAGRVLGMAVRNPIVRAVTNAGTDASLAYMGALGSDATRKKDALMAAAFSASIGAVSSMNKKTWREYSLENRQRAMKELESAVPPKVTDYQHLIRLTDEYDELPTHIKNQLTPEEFHVSKATLAVMDDSNEKIRELAFKVGGDKVNVDPRAMEHFRQTVVSDTPEGALLRDHGDTLELIHSGRTMEGLQTEKALLDTLSSVDKPGMVKEVEAPIGTRTNSVPAAANSLLMRAEPLYNHPEQFFAFLDSESPGLALAVKERLGRFPIADLYFNRVQASLNRNLDVSPKNMLANKAAWGNEQLSTPALTELAFPTTAAKRVEAGDASVKSVQDLEVKKLSIQQSIVKDLMVMREQAADPFAKATIQDAMEDFGAAGHYTRYMTDELANTITDRLEKVAPTVAIKKKLSQLQKLDLDKLELIKSEVEQYGPTSNLNKSVTPDRPVAFLNTEREQLAYELTNTSTNAEPYIRDAIFKSRVDPIVEPVILSVSNKTGMLQSVEEDIGNLKAVLGAVNDGALELSPGSMKGTKKFLKVLEKYESDRRFYQGAIDHVDEFFDRVSSGDQSASFPLFLSDLNYKTRNISNPAMAAELRSMTEKLKKPFFDYMYKNRTWLHEVEMEALWQHTTGNVYNRFRVDLENPLLFNDATVNSMFKAFNYVGRDILDIYAGVYEKAFSKPLDKDMFHSFFMTPKNEFDANGAVMKGLLGNYVRMRVERKEKLNSREFSILQNMKGTDWLEQSTEAATELSSGVGFTMMHHDLKRSKLALYSLMHDKFLTEGDGGLLKIINEHPTFKMMEDTTVSSMLNKANLMNGHLAGVYIDEFAADGSWKLTHYGEFIKSLYDDLDGTKRGLDSEPEGFYISDKLTKFIESKKKSIPEAEYLELNRLKESYERQAIDYWNYFDDTRATEKFNAMLEWRKLQAQVDAKLLQMQNETIRNNNKVSAQVNGPQLQEIRFRSNRVRNRKRSDSGLTHTYSLAFEDSRVFNLLSTNEERIATYADTLTNDTLSHPLDAFLADIHSRVTNSHTAHARATLESYAVGLSGLGFKNHADMIFNKIDSGGMRTLEVEYARPERMIARWAAQKPGGLRIVHLTGQAVTAFAMPFGMLVRPSSLMKNNAQAAGTAFITGKKDLSSFLGILTSPLKMLFMFPTHNVEGKTRAMVKNKPQADLVNSLMDGVRDTMHSTTMANTLDYARAGKTYDMGSAHGRLMAFGDFTNTFFFRNLKERSEIYASRTAMDTGLVVAQNLKKLLEEGNDAEAYKTLSNVMTGQASSKVQWLMNNFKQGLEKGGWDQSLPPFLKIFHDHTVGRFGSFANSVFIDNLARVVPGVGLFFSATNMMKFRFLSALEVSLSKAPDAHQKGYAPLISMLASAAAVQGLWMVMQDGFRGPVEDLTGYKKEVTDLNSSDASFWSKLWEKTYSNGLIPWVDAKRYAPADFQEIYGAINNDPKSKSLFQLGGTWFSEVLGFGQLTRFNENSLGGVTWQRMGPNLQKMFNYMSMAPYPEEDGDGAIGAASFVGLGDAALYDEYLKNPTSIEAREKLMERYASRYSERWARSADILLDTLTPYTVVSDLLSNPVTIAHWYQTLKRENEAHSKYNILERQVKELQESGIDEAGQRIMDSTGRKPIQMMDELTLLPVYAMGGLFNKTFGLTENFDTSFYPAFIDSIMNWAMDMKLIDSKMADRLKELHLRHQKELMPDDHGSIPEKPEWTEEDVNRGALGGGWKNPRSVENLEKELESLGK